MAGTLTLQVANITVTKNLNATNAELEIAFRNIARIGGYGDNADTDPPESIIDFVLNLLVSHARDLNKSVRIDAAVQTARELEQSAQDALDK